MKYFACYLVSIKSFQNRNFSADVITSTLGDTLPSGEPGLNVGFGESSCNMNLCILFYFIVVYMGYQCLMSLFVHSSIRIIISWAQFSLFITRTCLQTILVKSLEFWIPTGHQRSPPNHLLLRGGATIFLACNEHIIFLTLDTLTTRHICLCILFVPQNH